MYSERPSLESAFAPAREITTGPIGVTDPFMAPDCGRLYFSAAFEILYAHQQ